MAARKSAEHNQKATAVHDVPAAELTSFLRDYRTGMWTERELANCLRIGIEQAKEVIAFFN